MTEHEQPSNLMATLAQEDPQISLASTMSRVEELRSRRSRRRIIGSALASLTVLGIAFWLLKPGPASTVVVSNNAANRATSAAPSTETPTTESVLSDVSPLLSGSTKIPSSAGVTTKVTSPSSASKEPHRMHHDVVLRALDFDKAVYEEITTIVGGNDDVIMIPNTQSKQTCLQVVCEGGEARSRYCWAPSPSPVMITSLDGRKVMRVEGGVTPSSHLLALATRLNDDSVLVWYEASPAFLSRLRAAGKYDPSENVAAVLEQSLHSVDLQRCSPSRMMDGTVRMDVASCSSHDRVVGVDLSDLAGRPIPSDARYTYEGNGKAVIVLSSVPAGVAYVNLRGANGTSDTFPVVLP